MKSARSPLVPVPLSEDILQGLSVWQTYLLSELPIVSTDASWRSIAAADQDKFVTNSATYVFIIIDKPYHKYRKTLS